MNIIYVLQKGEYHEGSHILDIYNNEDSALRELAKCFNHRFDMYKDWKVGTTDHTDMMPIWEDYPDERGRMRFQSGCDYWEVVELEVKD